MRYVFATVRVPDCRCLSHWTHSFLLFVFASRRIEPGRVVAKLGCERETIDAPGLRAHKRPAAQERSSVRSSSPTATTPRRELVARRAADPIVVGIDGDRAAVCLPSMLQLRARDRRWTGTSTKPRGTQPRRAGEASLTRTAGGENRASGRCSFTRLNGGPPRSRPQPTGEAAAASALQVPHDPEIGYAAQKFNACTRTARQRQLSP